MLEPLDPAAVAGAALRSGLSEKDVVAALVAFRAANSVLDEPEWQVVSHMTGRDFAIAVYGAEGTKVGFQMETPRHQDGSFGKGKSCYTFGGKAYDTFGEARYAEMLATTPQPKGTDRK